MTEDDRPLDLSALAAGRDARADRLTARLMERVAAVRETERVRDDVRRRLARFAFPGALAATIGFLAILAVGRRETPHPEPELFTLAVMGQTPAARWIALGQAPGIEELLQAMGGR